MKTTFIKIIVLCGLFVVSNIVFAGERFSKDSLLFTSPYVCDRDDNGMSRKIDIDGTISATMRLALCAEVGSVVFCDNCIKILDMSRGKDWKQNPVKTFELNDTYIGHVCKLLLGGKNYYSVQVRKIYNPKGFHSKYEECNFQVPVYWTDEQLKKLKTDLFLIAFDDFGNKYSLKRARHLESSGFIEQQNAIFVYDRNIGNYKRLCDNGDIFSDMIVSLQDYSIQVAVGNLHNQFKLLDTFEIKYWYLSKIIKVTSHINEYYITPYKKYQIIKKGNTYTEQIEKIDDDTRIKIELTDQQFNKLEKDLKTICLYGKIIIFDVENNMHDIINIGDEQLKLPALGSIDKISRLSTLNFFYPIATDFVVKNTHDEYSIIRVISCDNSMKKISRQDQVMNFFSDYSYELIRGIGIAAIIAYYFIKFR